MSVKTIIDRRQAGFNQRRAAALGVEGADFLYRAVAEDLELRLAAVNRRFERGVLFVPDAAPDIGFETDGSGTPDIERYTQTAAGREQHEEVPQIDPATCDLAVSLLSLHETNDTPGVLAQIKRALRPDGLFLACLPGGDTLHELRDSLLSAEVELTGAANARVLPFMEVRDAGALLQRAGFALPVADRETITVRYDTMFDLMRDLRAMGATNTLATRSRQFSHMEMFARAAQHYAQNHSDADGRIRATFTFIWMSGWAPHETQQEPLKPGSGTVRLSAVLGDKSRQ